MDTPSDVHDEQPRPDAQSHEVVDADAADPESTLLAAHEAAGADPSADETEPFDSDPAHADRSHTDTSHTDPADIDTSHTDTSHADTSDGELSREFKRAIEAVIIVAEEPVQVELLAQLLEQPAVLVERWCEELREEYRDRGFELARVAGGYRYQTRAEQAPYVERFVLHDQRARLSGAALETLAIIAYKQPISRAQIASIRGVDPDGVIRTLVARGYIDEVGRDDGPGQAVLFGTTPAFLDKLGLDSLDDLPPIAEFIPEADVVEALEQGLRTGLDG